MALKKSKTVKREKDTVSEKSEISDKEKKNKERFYIVGMGASAGGLESFEVFFKNMPENNKMAFVLISHLDPKHISIMPQLLQKYTKMKVFQAEDGMKVEPNSVYVIPPNKNMGILNRTLQLIEPPEPRGARLPIDFFFRTLAADQGRNAVCIILSGTGSDGTLGLKAVKGEAGLVIVQDELSAKYDGMPRSAICTGLADYILPPEKIPDQLVRYASHVLKKAAPITIPEDGIIPDVLQKIYILLRTHTGQDFSSYKQNTICRRIERRMNVHQMDNISNYVRYLQENTHEIQILFKELLIGVTNFFRDPEAFEFLREKVLYQALKEKYPNDPIRIWIPGCSTGEEAYSVAILIYEFLDEFHQNTDVQIFGTDIDIEAIDKARTGIYPSSISADVSETRLKRFFIKEGEQYRIKKNIREMLIFAPHNIIKDPPFTKLDLLCCRNLLIYLGSELQKKLLPVFHYSLLTDGLLFLGSSETVGDAGDLFSIVETKWKIYKRRPSEHSTRAALEFPGVRQMTGNAEQYNVTPSQEVSPSVSQLAEIILQQTSTPPCVIIDRENSIVYIHGRTGKYLEPAPGNATLNILKMARHGLKNALTNAISKARTQKQNIICKNLRVKTEGGYTIVSVTIRPVPEPANMQEFIIVMFEEEPSEISKPGKKSSVKQALERISDLEYELSSSKENLQTTIEELEASNEELKSTNEELQSTNEELQSTNEELETSKEELQSLNEEAETVNAELQGRINALSKANDDMRNLLDSTEVATIFLDRDMNITRFTPRATDLINLIQTDVGRPFSHFASNLKYEGLVMDAEKVLSTLVFRETEVQHKNGQWYSMRIVPYRTITDMIVGVVITFQDITQQKKAEKNLRDSETKWRSITENSPYYIMTLDQNGNIEFINRAIQDLPKEDVINTSIFKYVSEKQRPVMKKVFKRVWETGKTDQFEGEYLGPQGVLGKFESLVWPIMQSDKTVALTVSAREIPEDKE